MERSLLWAVFVLGWLAFILSWLAVPVWEPQALLYPVAITLALYLVHCSLVAMGSYADELLLPLMVGSNFLGGLLPYTDWIVPAHFGRWFGFC